MSPRVTAGPKSPAKSVLSDEQRQQIAEQKTALFRALCRREGLAEPTTEYHFAKPERAWRFDYAWPDAKVALEVEGGVWTGGRHTRGAGYVEDIAKYNRAVVLGWRVFRTTPAQLETTVTVRMIRGAVNAPKLWALGQFESGRIASHPDE